MNNSSNIFTSLTSSQESSALALTEILLDPVFQRAVCKVWFGFWKQGLSSSRSEPTSTEDSCTKLKIVFHLLGPSHKVP